MTFEERLQLKLAVSAERRDTLRRLRTKRAQQHRFRDKAAA